MFDGNHRSRTRNIRYGSKTSSSRQSILEATQKQRQQRAALQRRKQAALALQRLWRGCRTRKHLFESWDRQLDNAGTITLVPLLNARLRRSVPTDKVTPWLRKLVVSTGERSLADAIVRSVLENKCNDEELGARVLQGLLGSDPWKQLGFGSGYQRAAVVFLEQSLPKPQQAILAAALIRSAPSPAVTAVVLLVGGSPTDTVSLQPLRDAIHAVHAGDPASPLMAYALSNKAPLILSSLLESSNSTDVSVVLSFMQNHPLLKLYTGLVAKGDPLTMDTSTVESDDKSLSDEEDEDKHVSPHNRKRKSTTVERGTTLHKRDLLTVPKLDRLVKDRWAAWRNSVWEENSSSVSSFALLAHKLASPTLWISWATGVLDNGDVSNFVLLLDGILAQITGVKTRQSAMLPLLTNLSMMQIGGASLLSRLWEAIQRMSTTTNWDRTVHLTAWSVFSDLFSQHLFAMKDDQFLDAYTSLKGGYPQILVEQVIGQLKDHLYDFYWNAPIHKDDYQNVFGPPSLVCSRARLMLAGSKLFNLLHERWCRITPRFCPEATWLFPTPLGATVAAVESVDDMDVDNEDSDIETEEDTLADSFSDAKTARVLTFIPHVLPFDKRVKLFQSLISVDRKKTEATVTGEDILRGMREGNNDFFHGGREKVNIRREHLYQDSKKSLNKLGRNLRKSLQVTFVNKLGAEESGIDGGGVMRDAFLFEEGTTAPHRLFEVTPMQTLGLNTAVVRDSSTLEDFEFAGRVLGKALYESILVDPQFCLPFLNQLLGKTNTLEDLKSYDIVYYKNLTKLLSLSKSDIPGLGLTFELTLDHTNDRAHTVELIPGGRNIPVSGDNVIQYVHLVANQRLNVETATPAKAFLTGFRDLVPAPWVRMFSAHELQKLVSGDDSVKGLDVASLKRAMSYASGYHESQPVIQWFWDTVTEMSPEQQRKFLRFMTSCSRQPLLGFASLDPPPCVQQLRIPATLRETQDLEALAKGTPLPSASTCMNLLKLPNYPSKQLLKWKLLAAIESGAGFELT